METTTNQITTKLHKQFADKFVPVGEELRAEGMSDSYIIKAYNNLIKAETRKFYRAQHEPTSLKTSILSSIQEISGKSADSKIELYYCDFLNEAHIPFEFQYKIGKFRADFLIAKWLVFEIDGPLHDKDKDAFRDKYMRGLGYDVFRVPAWLASVNHEAVIEEIKELINQNE
jgi:very-short-patch-repair endonuclease